jgi:PST family polysaccharide transporter
MQDFDTATIGKKSAQGIVALASRTFVLNIISFATSLVIYTILTPHDVGVYTAVIAIQRIISFFTDFGFGAALIQKKEELSKEDIHTTFTLQFGLTASIFLLVLILRPVLESFFKLQGQAYWLLAVLVFTIFLSSFKTIPSILLERRIHYHKLVLPQIVESIVFNAVLLVLVLAHFGLSGFTWAFLLSGVISIPFYYYVSPWKPGFGIDKESLTHLKFGLQFQAKNVLATIKDDLIIAVLPKIISYTDIGYIGFAQRIAFFVYRYVVDSVTKVTFSAYSRLQEDKTVLKKALEKSLFFVSVVMFPMLIGLIFVMPYIISYFPKWHNKWEAAIVSLTFFLLNAAVSSISGILVNALDANGKVKITLRLMGIWTLLTWILVPLFVKIYGYNGVAIAQFLITLTIVYTVYLVKKVVNIEVIKSIYQPIIATAGMTLVLVLVNPVLVHNFITLGLSIIIAGAIYCSILYALAGSILKRDISMIFNRK